MSKKINSAIVDELSQRLSPYSDFIVCDFSLVNAAANSNLRRRLRECGFYVICLKNSSARKVFGIACEVSGCESVLSRSSTLICGSTDIVDLAKKSLECLISFPSASVKGAVSGGLILSQQDVVNASTSPSRCELLSQLVSYIESPSGAVVLSIQSAEHRIVYQVNFGLVDRV